MDNIKYLSVRKYAPIPDSASGQQPWAVVDCTNPPARVSLDSTGQHTLEWAEPLKVGGRTVAPGKLNIYTYPGNFSNTEISVIRLVMLALARQALHLFEVPDPVGAYVIHALLVCNTDASLELGALSDLDARASRDCPSLPMLAAC